MLPTYRTPFEIRVNEIFFAHLDTKDEILDMLKVGFTGEWSKNLPSPRGPVKNYFSEEVIPKCRARFQSEMQKGRMLGGPGWSEHSVTEFLRSKIWVTPCGAVPKGDDPHGRIIHDYSYASEHDVSLNSCLQNTAVRYISFVDRARKLASCNWYFAVDLENGYRQLPVHPSDWPTQVYSLGPNEYYIDICMPFGKANSSKVFCFWVTNWCRAFRFHFEKRVSYKFALESYVDDIFGGAATFKQTMRLKNEIIRTGWATTAKANLKKCHGPSQQLKILGMVYDAVRKRCSLPPSKVEKYILRIDKILRDGTCTSREAEKLVGNLVWASYVEP